MANARTISLAEDRMLTYDDVGDPAGRPALYLHGTPDSRLARHPDDTLAARAGIRLLAVDRPGYGGTSPRPPGAGPESFGYDLAALLDNVRIDHATLLAWSGGALAGLAAAATPPLNRRLTELVLVAGLVPREALEETRRRVRTTEAPGRAGDPRRAPAHVVGPSDPPTARKPEPGPRADDGPFGDDPVAREVAAGRLGLLGLADGLAPEELADSVAPLLVPYPCDRALALDHQREQREPADQTALALIPGALDRLADALVEAVRPGLMGVATDIADQATPLGSVLDRVRVPVTLWYAEHDTVTPAGFGRWYARRLPHARLHIVEGAGHYLPFTHWPDLLAAPRQ